ncbi:FAD-dependent monooxygenase [Nocardia sp. alder85J]|uniref:FAD-dependent monooxygenase n=1 Tax=Nocardia sp. alder85J TaxID=2862949 RepID=UPI0022509158|nr:FAD-dependent monooxygenase [Nocardia sp. alder85J]
MAAHHQGEIDPGDAAHVHSPAGGPGMNIGVQDGEPARPLRALQLEAGGAGISGCDIDFHR